MTLTKRQALAAIFGTLGASAFIPKAKAQTQDNSLFQALNMTNYGKIIGLQVDLADSTNPAVDEFVFVFKYKGKTLEMKAKDIWEALGGK